MIFKTFNCYKVDTTSFRYFIHFLLASCLKTSTVEISRTNMSRKLKSFIKYCKIYHQKIIASLREKKYPLIIRVSNQF